MSRNGRLINLPLLIVDGAGMPSMPVGPSLHPVGHTFFARIVLAHLVIGVVVVVNVVVCVDVAINPALHDAFA